MSDFLSHDEVTALLQGTVTYQEPTITVCHDFTKQKIAELEAANLKVIEQAAVIEQMVTELERVRAVLFIHGLNSHKTGCVLQACKTDSKQILNDWMREQKDVQDDNK